MLRLFSEYLRDSGIPINGMSLDDLVSQALAWYEEVDCELQLLNKYFHKLTMIMLRGGILEFKETRAYIEFDRFIRNLMKENFVNNIDRHFQQIIGFLIQEGDYYFLHHPIDFGQQFYPFNQLEQCGGVKMCCRLRLADGTLYDLKSNFEARSFVGAKDKRIKDVVKDNFEKTSAWLEPILKKMGKSYNNIIDWERPHAEDIWMTQYGKNIVDQLKETGVKNESISDHFPLTYLSGARLEFIISSSCCEKCIIYFQALKRALDDKDIHIPIVIFANRNTNTGEQNCAIFTIDKKYNYIQLAIQWKGSLLEKNHSLPRHIDPPVNLSEEYKTALTLKIFGDINLLMLVRSRSLYTESFISTLLTKGAISNLMLDWLKYYSYRALTLLSFDFSNTQVFQKFSRPANYEIIDYRFFMECDTIPGMLQFCKELIRLALSNRDNVVGFFSFLVSDPACPDYLFSKLLMMAYGYSNTEKKLATNPRILEIAHTVRKATILNEMSAPEERIERICIDDSNIVSVTNEKALEFYNHLKPVYNGLNFLDIELKFQRNILNAMFTHPNDSPLQEENLNCSGEDITILVDAAIKAIKAIVYKNQTFDMQQLENIFNFFDRKMFYPELKKYIDAIRKQNKRKHFEVFPRAFSIAQVKEDGCLSTVIVRRSHVISVRSGLPRPIGNRMDFYKQKFVSAAEKIADRIEKEYFQDFVTEYDYAKSMPQGTIPMGYHIDNMPEGFRVLTNLRIEKDDKGLWYITYFSYLLEKPCGVYPTEVQEEPLGALEQKIGECSISESSCSASSSSDSLLKSEQESTLTRDAHSIRELTRPNSVSMLSSKPSKSEVAKGKKKEKSYSTKNTMS